MFDGLVQPSHLIFSFFAAIYFVGGVLCIAAPIWFAFKIVKSMERLDANLQRIADTLSGITVTRDSPSKVTDR